MIKALARIIDFVTWVVTFLLVARFIMQFFGAKTAAPFVAWLYSTTADLMSPFVGIFPTFTTPKHTVVDTPAIIAATIFGIFGYAISAFLDAIADHMAYRPLSKEQRMIKSPNPVAPSVASQQSINKPIH